MSPGRTQRYLAVDVVLCEPVSAENSLLTGKIQGIMAALARFWEIYAELCRSHSGLRQNSLEMITGKLTRITGRFI